MESIHTASRPTLLSYITSALQLRPELIASFANVPSYVYSREFLEATMASQEPVESRDGLVRKANNNLLVTSLLLGICFSMIGGDYTPYGWDPLSDAALIYESTVEALALSACFLLVCGLLANMGLATTAACVRRENFRLWAKANLLAISCAELTLMGGIWCFSFAMAAAGFAAIPHTSVFIGCMACIAPVTAIVLTLNLNVAPLAAACSGVFKHDELVSPELQMTLTPAEAEEVLYRRALAAEGVDLNAVSTDATPHMAAEETNHNALAVIATANAALL